MNEVPWQRLDRRTVRVTALIMLGVALGVGIPISIGLLRSGTSVLVVAAFVVPAAALLIGGGASLDFLRWRHTHYRLTDKRVEVQHSFVVRKLKSVPRERVRSADIDANPLHRSFGLAKVKIGTGSRRSPARYSASRCRSGSARRAR
ncbi:MAG: PH domain-containing protein [Actinomycetota bacterium]|nr:PH domain-containing protein [Actinomycetota bacterium]